MFSLLRKAALSSAMILSLVVVLPTNALAAESGHMTFNGGWTTNHSPVLTGTLPAFCSDMGLDITDDTGTEIPLVYGYTPGFAVSNGNWSLDLAQANVSLINGYYHVFIESPCGTNDYSNPAYEDIFMDSLYIVPQGCDSTCSPLHRFYNIQNGSHFYTDSEDETYQVMQETGTYRYEGIDSFVSSVQGPGMLPVHRFYDFLNGTHFYTTNQQEATLINDTEYNTYHYEGIAYYANTSPSPNMVPVYRFYDFINGSHFYTTNQQEATTINNTEYNTYRYEGISYYDVANAN